MQKWEYLRVYHYLAEGIYQVNGEDYAGWRGRKVDAVLNDLGAEAWELVSAVGNVNPDRAGPATSSYYFFFKRPLLD